MTPIAVWCHATTALAEDVDPVAQASEVEPQRNQDVNHLWVRGYAGLAYQPLGVIGDVAAEVRFPVLRFGGIAFNDTFFGIGARAAITPVHAEFAARASFQPIDLLPITVEGFWANFWDSPWGPVPLDRVENQTLEYRGHLYDEKRDFLAQSVGVNVIPTFQIQYKRVAAFTSWTFTFMKTTPVQGPEPWYFEPYRGMVLAYEDRVIEHTSAIVWDFKNGKDHTSLLRVGPALRGKFAKNTTDHTLEAGGLVMWRPGRRERDATFTLIVTEYLQDPDFGLGVPHVVLVVSASRILPLQKLRGL